MKKTVFLLSLASLLFAACHDHHDNPNEHCRVPHKYHGKPHGSEGSCEYIPVDSANKMIGSYLNSINYQQDDTDLDALVYNADSLRAYLSDQRVVGVKFMFAHTLDYINQGGQDQYCGYQSGALTFVIAGYDVQGNYIFYYYPKSNTAMVKDHCNPCPSECPQQGPAAGYFLQNSSNTKGR